MTRLKRYFTQRTNGYVWNSLAGIINAMEMVILSAVASRTNGIDDVGVLTIAFAVGNLMRTIGMFGCRSFQVTDAKNKYSFKTYLNARFVSAVLMLVSSIVFLLYKVFLGEYTFEKALVVLLVCLIYVIEAIEDVFYGLYQKNKAIDIGGKSFFFRWLATLLVMCVSLITVHNLIVSCALGLITTLTVFLVLISLIYPEFREQKETPVSLVKIASLFKEILPLFAVSFLSFYIINAPKYAIDKLMSDEIQAYYGFVAMPVFVIGLLANFAYQPVVVNMGNFWKERNMAGFYGIIKRQLLIILLITAISLAGAWFLGIPVLSWFYAADLTDYKACLMILLTGGSFLAFGSFFTQILTVLRRQKFAFGIYLAAAIMAAIGFYTIVERFGVLGAAVFFAFITFMEAISFAVLCAVIIKREKTGGNT